MPTREEKLEAMLKDFETRTQGDANKPGENLRHVLDSSPDLKERVLESVDKDQLKKFELLPANAHAGGSYDPTHQIMNLPQDKLDVAGKDKAATAELVFVTGHEIQHSLNSPAYVKAAEKQFTDDAWKIATGPGPHDYTAAIKDKLQVNRKDEAEANLGGFNALASQVQKDKPGATLEDIYKANPFRMNDFIDVSGTRGHQTYTMKPDLALDRGKDGKSIMHITASAQNVEAMGKHYFDKGPAEARLGTHGNQDYKHYYGEGALATVDLYEKTVNEAHQKADPKYTPPEVRVDLKQLGLDKSLLDPKLNYTDTSPGKTHPILEGAGHPEHSTTQPAKGPFGDPALDQAYRAMQKGDDAQLNAAVHKVNDSSEGQRLAQTGRQLLSEQPRPEQPIQQPAPTHTR